MIHAVNLRHPLGTCGLLLLIGFKLVEKHCNAGVNGWNIFTALNGFYAGDKLPASLTLVGDLGINPLLQVDPVARFLHIAIPGADMALVDTFRRKGRDECAI